LNKHLISGLLVLGLAWSALALDNAETRLTETIKKYINTKNPSWQEAEIQVLIKPNDKDLVELKSVNNAAVLKVLELFPDFRPVGNVIFPISVSTDNGSKKIFLRAKVEVLKPVVAADSVIKKGNQLRAGDLKIEVRDVALLPQKYYTSIDQLMSKEAKISIPRNSTIFEWMIGEPPVVKMMQKVTIVIVSPGVAVRADGLAMEDGQLGQTIRVKRTDSRKYLSGKVVSPTEVEVQL